ncbi:XdhC family protein [Paenibacillus sp. JDR-2]|uniref:XdhC family protein n=1 Tax=Paenibacillus sp. (strain JDR-2) TaxID=324057 RepID=UPI000166BC14|nr:XdhC family protein [Paenibacillus sp. JDR-2]ACT01961.1 Xanthine dehydrogenase [Paenibacillus sp. JDR-2]
MDMINILRTIRRLDQPAVLATIIGVEGHAYRKTGAAMLFPLSGDTVGTVSPGCIESDLLERVPSVWEANRYEIAEYNMDPDDDPIWGEAVGCGGVIRVLLEPIAGSLRAILTDALDLLDSGREVQLVRGLKGEKLCYELAAEEVRQLPSSQSCYDWQLSLRLTNRQRVILFGAGPDAVPIYQLLTQSSFHVIVADWRPRLLAAYPGAEHYLGTPEQLRGRMHLSAEDAVIICSHHLHYDREMIEWSLALKPTYIGVMGSTKRIGMLFNGEIPPANVKAPIGLSIGAEGPCEIAVSIAAELIALRYQWRNKQKADRQKEERHEPIRNLFGGGTEQPNGQTEAAARAFAGRSAWQSGASCSLG